MKTINRFIVVLTVGAGLASAGCSRAQYGGGYQQPGYGSQQPAYQPDYSNQGYDNQGYDNQQYGYQQQPGYANSAPDFYNTLSPYGQWVQTPQYGTVWIPNVAPGFQPYATSGHWVVTEYGNTWVSDYPWGWAPFHYGRWYFDNYRGWAWIPGNDWGPAWVSWRSGGGYYGWAPLGPGLNLNVNATIPANFWVFVPQIYITSPQIYSYYVPRPRVVNIYQSTTIINNIYRSNNRAYVYGPPRGDIERVTRQSVPVYRVDNMDRPGRTDMRNGSVGMYRPGAGSPNRGGFDRPNQPSDQPNYNRSTDGSRGGYTAPFDNRPSLPTNTGRSNNTPSGSGQPSNDRGGRGSFNSGFNNSGLPTTPAPTSPTLPNRDADNSPTRGANTSPASPGRGFDNNPARGSYTPPASSASPGRGFDNSPARESYTPSTAPATPNRGFDNNPARGSYTPPTRQLPTQVQPSPAIERTQSSPSPAERGQSQPFNQLPRQEQSQPQAAPSGRGQYQPAIQQPQVQPQRQEQSPRQEPASGGRGNRGPR